MQEVFKKIIDKLEEERDQSYADFDKYVNEYSPYLDSEYDDFFHKGLERASRLVKQVEAEYKDGWIPCSERLPEEYTVLCCDVYGEMIIGHPYMDEISDTNYIAQSETEKMYNCIAWQPLPEPYQTEDN